MLLGLDACSLRCLTTFDLFFLCFQGGKVPVDGLRIQKKFEGVHSALLWFVFAVSSLGILMAIAFLTFNVYNQNVR